MYSFIQCTVIGVAMGMIYALLAMGLILLIRSVGVLNFAQGDLFMVGAYVVFTYGTDLHFPLGGTLAAALLTFALIGLVFMFTIWWPVRNSTWAQATIICTMGASSVIKELVLLIWGPIPLVMDPIVGGTIKIGKVVLQNQYLVIIGVTVVIVLAVFTLYEKLYAGRVMQAATQDRYAARILGIPVTLTISITYMIVCSIAGIAGGLVGPIFFANTSLGVLQSKAFASVVIGGFGNLKGAVIGGLIIGLIEAYSTFVTTTYKDAIVFLVLIIVLMVRPQGIFGERIADKA